MLELVESDMVADPAAWFPEVSNGLRAAQRRKLVTPAEKRQALDGLAALVLTVDQHDPLSAFVTTATLAEQHGLSVYDATYLEVALRRSLALGSRDRALLAVARRCGVTVVS